MNKIEQQTLAVEQKALPASGRRSREFASIRSQPSVDLHVEELVLNGFVSVDRRRVGEALERELVRLITDRGLPEAMRHEIDAELLEGEIIGLLPSTRAEVLGVRIAQALYGGLTR